MSAPFQDLGSFLTHLERAGRLHRITCAVDKDSELACVVRWFIESFPPSEARALLFENVTGYSVPVAVNLYPTHDFYADALGVAADHVLEHWARALENPLSPALVADGPAQEVVQTGSDATVNEIPIPTWTPGRDAGAYFSAGHVITKDPATGIQNLGSYRLQIHSPGRIGVFFGSKLQHGAMHRAAHIAKGVPMPVALVVGAPPAVNFSAAAKTAYGVDELTIAGGLMKKPLEVLRAKTVDLLVPARAEYIIEGFIPSDASQLEGPFGEALGYMNDAAPAAYMNITAVTHRSRPIHHGYIQQLPPSEGHVVMEMGILGPLWYYLTSRLRLPGLRGLAIAPGSAGVATLVVQVDRAQRAAAAQIGRAIAHLNFGQRLIYLVDDNIDIRDAEALNWALSSRLDPKRDVTILDNINTFQLDPSVLARFAAASAPPGPPPYKSSLLIADATTKCDVPALSLPEPAAMEKVLKDWPRYGLPPIRPRARLVRLLDS